jgi:hypothetical protein
MVGMSSSTIGKVIGTGSALLVALALLWAGNAMAQDLAYPELSLSVKDAKSFKPVEYVNVSILCGAEGSQCSGGEGCGPDRDWSDRDWIFPRYGRYRAITGLLYLPKIGLGEMDVLAVRPEAVPGYFQKVCLRVWREGYEPLYVEKTLRPGVNQFDLFLKPAEKTEAGDGK